MTLTIFQSDFEAEDNLSGETGIDNLDHCSANQEFNHSTIAAPKLFNRVVLEIFFQRWYMNQYPSWKFVDSPRIYPKWKHKKEAPLVLASY